MKRGAAIKIFQTLGDAHRFAIVEHLMKAPHSVQELADKLPISRPAVSRHLRIYQLRAESLEALRDYFEQLWEEAQRRFAAVAENTRPPRR